MSLAEKKITSYTILEGSFELPRFNDSACTGQPYHYVYGADPRVPQMPNDRRPLYKVFIDNRQATSWSVAGCYASEPIFVPSPHAQNEDDGVVLAVIFEEKQQKSFLLILDAKSFQEMGRAEVAHAILPGLHGAFFKK